MHKNTDYRPFTESILADLAALPAEVRWEVLGEFRSRLGPALRVNWTPVLGAVALPLLILGAYREFGADLSVFYRGVMVGIAAILTLDAAGAVAGAIERQVAIWRVRRRDSARERS